MEPDVIVQRFMTHLAAARGGLGSQQRKQVENLFRKARILIANQFIAPAATPQPTPPTVPTYEPLPNSTPDATQKAIAEQVITRFMDERIWPNPIVTQVAPFDHFYKAEAYHQQYYRSNASQPYCQIVIAPKVAKFRKAYAYLLK